MRPGEHGLNNVTLENWGLHLYYDNRTAFDGPRSLMVPAPLTRIPVFVRATSPRADALVAAAAG